MSRLVHKSHNVSVLLYHLVCPAKYRRVVFTDNAEQALRAICLELSKRYEIELIEIGGDSDHVHFLIQSILTNSKTRIVSAVKSITAREVFERIPSVKKQFWGD